MAVVAGGGSVGITGYAAVSVVRLRLLVRRLRMAVDASKAAEVRGDLVAVVAHGAVVRDREEWAVIESCAEPGGGVVAAGGVAGGRESRGDVIGYGTTEGLRALPCC